MKDAGLGRIGYLSKPTKLSSIVDKLKLHFNLKHVRVALANKKTLGKLIESKAVDINFFHKIIMVIVSLLTLKD